MALSSLMAASLMAGCGRPEAAAPTLPVVLVVGDSLVAAAATELSGLSPGRADTVVVAGIGASPCDLLAGYRAPPTFGGRYLSFRAALGAARPKAVVLAFTGNPGISGHACITRPTTPYGLSEIVSAYRSSLSAMGTAAAAAGAQVYLSATPARNPGAPEGWEGQSQHGYNGDPEFNAMMSDLASSKGWTYDTNAAAAVSGPDLTWTLYLPCQGGVACVDGRQQVRYGGSDAIHCDAPGTNGALAPSEGSFRFARGLLTAPLANLGLRPPGQVHSEPTTVPPPRC